MIFIFNFKYSNNIIDIFEGNTLFTFLFYKNPLFRKLSDFYILQKSKIPNHFIRVH